MCFVTCRTVIVLDTSRIIVLYKYTASKVLFIIMQSSLSLTCHETNIYKFCTVAKNVRLLQIVLLPTEEVLSVYKIRTSIRLHPPIWTYLLSASCFFLFFWFVSLHNAVHIQIYSNISYGVLVDNFIFHIILADNICERCSSSMILSCKNFTFFMV